jgi:predicted DNA-binding protein
MGIFNRNCYFCVDKEKAMAKALTFVRLTDYTNMRISELVNMTGQNKSVVIRSLIDRSINELTDQDGNWKIDGKKSKTRKS